MYLFKNSTHNYDIIHDNLNDIWLIADLSNKKYKFYYRYKLSDNDLNIRPKFKLTISNTINIIISTILLLLLFISLNSSTRDMRNDKIYDNFYTEYPALSINRSNITIQNSFDEAIIEMDNKNYNEALKNFKTVIDEGKNPNIIIAHFYTGAILQEKGRYRYAIDEYEIVINNKDNLFIEQANWYIGLCYLKNHQEDKAIKYFEKLLYNSTYKLQAEKILKKIN